jgi:hypothetical protein
MKLRLKIAICFFSVTSVSSVIAEPLKSKDIEKVEKALGWDDYVQKTKQLSYEEAKMRWGQKPFSAQVFLQGNWRVRAPLAVDLLSRKGLYIGKSETQLRKELGRHDGFFWRDSIPAYIIEDGLETGKDSWQLVFFINRQNNVSDIRIYQNN